MKEDWDEIRKHKLMRKKRSERKSKKKKERKS